MTANVAAYHLARSASLIGVGIGTDQLLKRIGRARFEVGYAATRSWVVRSR